MNSLRTTLAVILASGLASTLLAACAAPAYVSPVEVTRFAAPQAVLGSGTISLRPAPGMDGDAIEFCLLRAAVATELERIGYQVVPDMGAQVATISLHVQVDQPERRGPVTVGGNAGLGSWGSGVGLGVGIDLNSLSGQPAERIDRQLSVTIRSSDAPANLWEGRARFTATANSQFAETAPAAAHAAAALFAGFPGQSGETVVVE